MKSSFKTLALGTALVSAASGVGCGDDPVTIGDGVDTLIILQRPARNDMGDIFQYTSYVPKTPSGKNARLVQLSPPTADGVQTTICCDQAGPEYANIDISGYDISFDARQIVFAGKLAANQAYGLFVQNLEDGAVRQLPTDPGRDYTSPIFLPGDKIMFTSSAVVEEGAPQHRDEYERGVTLQVGRINIDGTGEELGPRNLSHRTFPTLMADGHVLMTQWDHLGPMNAGHLVFMNQDMTQLREAFGKEGTGASNSTLKAREISPGRFVAIATSRNRTIQAGALIDVRLGDQVTDSKGNVSADKNKSEANATYRDLTPDVPHDMTPSAETIGRYYDAYPLNAKDKPDLLVSWADGPVESSVLGQANLSANFGVYLYNSERQTRRPILDDPEMWDVFPRALQTRSAPSVVASSLDENMTGVGQTIIGSMNVYDTTLFQFAPGSIYGVRVQEGFSSEEGFPEMFGSTMFEGMATLGVARVRADNSWAAFVPANVPLRLQAIDNFGMSVGSEPVWFSGRPGENRFCGGCHEDRTATTLIDPGLTDAVAAGPTVFQKTTAPREDRLSLDFSEDNLVGVPWDGAIQPMLTQKCAGCHNGTPGPANPSYTLSDGVNTLTWTFDLRGDVLPPEWVELGGDSHFTRSYLSMAGPDMEALEEGGFMLVSGTVKQYLIPENARGSEAIQLLNPGRRYPTPNIAERAFNTTPHMNGKGPDLTTAEMQALIQATDSGVQFFSRENNPGLTEY
ncbi:MAG: hypothetical protein ACKV2T_40680 [Kofleriaceae bacterium]